MLRTVFVGAMAFALLVSAAQVCHGGEVLLDKKDKLTAKDDGYKPDAKGDKLLAFLTGHPHKVFTLKLAKGDQLVIRMKSKELDSVVVVEDSKKTILAYNDDDPDDNTLDSKLVWTVPEAGEYRIIATRLDNSDGSFHLTVEKKK